MKLLDFNRIFPDEVSCEEYLRALSEQEGLVCPHCGGTRHHWDKYNKRWLCASCKHVITLRSGTLFQSSKLPLMYWFTAIHLLISTKKTFSVLEIQRQLGHKRYQPIWEMVHKIRSVMGQRDSRYKLSGVAELDEAHFTTEDEREEDEPLKRGNGSQGKTKVLVMVESEPVDVPGKGKEDRKAGHLRMVVIDNLKADTVKEAVNDICEKESIEVIMDASTAHVKVSEVVDKAEARVVKPKEGHKVLPWVHTAISNAKAVLTDMYHGIKREFLQLYLDEFCYKFNRRYFGERLFERLMIAAVCTKPSFDHRLYGSTPYCG